MKIGITCGGIGPYASGSFIAASARLAEKAGFAHYWVPEHVVQFADYPQSEYPYAEGSGQEMPEQDESAPLKWDDDTYAMSDPRNPLVDPVVAMTWAAAATSSIEVGSNILVLSQRNPVFLAKSLATVDSFSGGRVLLGVGVGWAKEEFDALGLDFSARGARTNEAIEALRCLWGPDYSTYEGRHFSFWEACSFPKPTRPGGIPVLVGGESKAALRRVARLGDGWLPYNLPVENAADVIAELKSMTCDAGRDPDKLRIIKIVYSNALLEDLKRYRDAGVTEFNIASSGELPLDEAGMADRFDRFATDIVGPVSEMG